MKRCQSKCLEHSVCSLNAALIYLYFSHVISHRARQVPINLHFETLPQIKVSQLQHYWYFRLDVLW